MRLEQELEPRRAQLDITPLIDVVFLLVLFFAVTTSFVSPENMDTLIERAAALTQDNARLGDTVTRNRDAIGTLNEDLEARRKDLKKARIRLDLTREQLAAAKRTGESQRLALDEAEKARAEERRRGRAGIAERDAAAKAARTRAGELETALAAANEDLARATAGAARAGEMETALAALKNDLGRAQGVAAHAGELEKALAAAKDDLAKARAEAARYKKVFDANQAAAARLEKMEKTLNENFHAMMLDSMLNVERGDDTLTIRLANRILFDTGGAKLKPLGLEVLRRVGQVLGSGLGRMDIQVGGHTDNVPVRGGFDDKLALSSGRAVSVVKFLQAEVGIDPQRLSGIGYGGHRPHASNETEKGRAANRRIELVLLPR